MKVDDVIEAYLKLRQLKQEIERKAKEQTSSITSKMDKLEMWLQQQAAATGVNSFKTSAGTAFVTTKDFANVADWQAVIDYVKANDAYDLFDRRVNKIAVRNRMDATSEPIPGVSYGSKIAVNVRKASSDE